MGVCGWQPSSSSVSLPSPSSPGRLVITKHPTLVSRRNSKTASVAFASHSHLPEGAPPPRLPYVLPQHHGLGGPHTTSW